MNFPTTRDIIRFVRTCMAANVPFKATAGLHHPIRCFKPLTYAPDAPQGTMHGFLNLLLMTGFARESYRVSLLEEVMEEEFEEVFEFHESTASTWRGRALPHRSPHRTPPRKGMHSFGSCSFDEPVADLQEWDPLTGFRISDWDLRSSMLRQQNERSRKTRKDAKVRGFLFSRHFRVFRG